MDDLPRGQHALSLLDWKRQVNEVYAAVRADDEPERAWRRWRERRDDLFRHHPQSPLPAAERATFPGLTYFDYDPAARVDATVEASDDATEDLPASAGAAFSVRRTGRAVFELYRKTHQLDLLWIGGYGGGLLLVFRDRTSGAHTYGGGRYLLDTIKGADLGGDGDRLILDFNFAYNPSCCYDPRWECPLAPAANHLDCDIRAGERLHVTGSVSASS